MAEGVEPHGGPLPLVKREADLLPLALAAAARAGDPDPELVQHVSGTREELTTLTGSIVHSDEPSYMIAIRGNFMTRQPFPPGPEWDHRRGETMSFPVKVLVVSIQSGQVIDSGSDRQYPDLAKVGPVVTDYRRAS